MKAIHILCGSWIAVGFVTLAEAGDVSPEIMPVTNVDDKAT